jgi:hypothetical protein
MDWPILAAWLDTEGYVGAAFHTMGARQSYAFLLPDVEIAQVDPRPMIAFRSFLHERGIIATMTFKERGIENPMGRQCRLQVRAKESLTQFINHVLTFLLLDAKRRRALRTLEIMELRPGLRRSGNHVLKPTAEQIFNAVDIVDFQHGPRIIANEGYCLE